MLHDPKHFTSKEERDPDIPEVPRNMKLELDGNTVEFSADQSGYDGKLDYHRWTVFDMPVRLGWITWLPGSREWKAECYPNPLEFEWFPTLEEAYEYLFRNPHKMTR